MTATPTVLPLPEHHAAAILATLHRLQPTGAQIADAIARMDKAVLIAWGKRPADQRAMDRTQFTELVEHTRYPQVLEAALTTDGTFPLANRITELVAELDA